MSARKPARTSANAGPYADMALTPVVSTLESHWVVLEAELSEIRKDTASLRKLTRQYGDNWKASLAQLKRLRAHKETLLKECARRALPGAGSRANC